MKETVLRKPSKFLKFNNAFSKNYKSAKHCYLFRLTFKIKTFLEKNISENDIINHQHMALMSNMQEFIFKKIIAII